MKRNHGSTASANQEGATGVAPTSALLSSLKALMCAIQTGDGDALRACLADVDRQTTALGPDTPPMLCHYLEKRSYAKAIEFLEGRDQASAAPRG